MRKTFTLFLFLLTAICVAKDREATIYYLNGTSETGLIKSFLENDLFDFNLFKSFEKGLRLNDQSVKFRTSENSESKTIQVDDVDKIIVHYENHDREYKALYIRKIDKNGDFLDPKVRIFLPLVRTGSINLYGFYHRESSQDEYAPVYYLQNEKDNFAVNYHDFNMLFNSNDRHAKPLKQLFNDCPEIIQQIDDNVYMTNLSKQEKRQLQKEQMNEAIRMMKEYRKIPKQEKRGDLVLYYKYHFYFVNNLILEY